MRIHGGWWGEVRYRLGRLTRWLPATRGYVQDRVWADVASRVRREERIEERLGRLERRRDSAVARQIMADPGYLGGTDLRGK